jgi:methylmalonyl-CoA mutase N-terminal domain/subunit
MDDVVVFWGGRKAMHETFAQVAGNMGEEFTEQEARNASIILQAEDAVDEFLRLVHDSFERGGISDMLLERASALMEEVAARHARH